MKSRRNRNTTKKRTGISDISPSTSLPPLVEGQLRCFLRITVSKLLWTITKPPASVIIRLRWWGETSDGTLFRPRVTSQTEQKTVKTTARFAIRCGPKQFSSYLTDMGVLVLEVMTKADHLPIGRVQINGLSQLSPTHHISGFFTIVSPTSEKLGELQVSLALEPLSETYDSCTSIPATDVSSETALSTQGPHLIIVPSQPQKLSGTTANGKESASSSRATTPRGRDHLYFQENTDTSKDSFFESHHHLNLEPITQDESLKDTKEPRQWKFLEPEELTKPIANNHHDLHRLSLSNAPTKDLLSALLDQGNKLRNAMVVSAMKSNPETSIGLGDIYPPINKDTDKVTRSSLPTSRRLLKSLEDISTSSPFKDPLSLLVEQPGQKYDSEAETRAIQLLLGSVEFSPMRYWEGMGTPPESISAESDIYDHSELNDPHYDQSLLEHLFYSAPKSDSSLSGISEDDDINSSRKTMKKSITRSSAMRLHRSKGATDSSTHEPNETALDGKHRRHLPSPEDPPELEQKAEPIKLTVDRLTLLGRIRLARVIVESLKVPPESNHTTPSKKTQQGKPPRPGAPVKRTFFVEFHFPVASSKNGSGQATMTTEITRIASSKIAGGVVAFRQRFVFPVHFSGMMIEHWWTASLPFKVFLRKSTQKKPVMIGSATLSLRDIIQSETLYMKWDLPVHPVAEDSGQTQFGPLKISMELAGDSKDFTSANSKISGAAQPHPSYAVTSPGVQVLEPESNVEYSEQNSPYVKQITLESPKPTRESRQVFIEIPRADVTHHQQPMQLPTSRNLMRQFSGPMQEEEDGVLLYVILMVPNGKDFMMTEHAKHCPCNVYLNIKLFNTPEASRSSVVWGTREPAFHFSQVAPVSLTRRLMERLKNNVMVIEAWNKVPRPGQDKLLGLVKLPLHQFYMSFSDPKISRLLFQAQYPVVAVDSYMPVIDMFTGSRTGSLRVLLAMGSSDQVVALQRLKNDEVTVPSSLQRPAHFLDPPLPSGPVVERQADGLTEHTFEIHVEKVKGLTPLQSTVWGEADCYVQYYFPVQESNHVTRQAMEQLESGVSLKPVRSSTTLCIPDPVFNDKQNHSLLSLADVPVQRLLLSAFSTPGQSGGGIPFEIWCRYYYPNVRDQMVAKGFLPLSRLCAMVTMQHREEVGIQTFNLPLTPRVESADESQQHSSGLLNVSIKYRRSTKTTTGVLAARAVSISVQVHRASGLQAAARVIAEQHSSFQYSADVGVNAYVTLHLSFLPDDQKRHTRAVAMTFYPEFDHHAEFPCNLVIQRSTGEASSLAEILQNAEAVFSVYHQNIAQAGEARFRSSQDYLLGVVKVPTRELLNKRSGISGWYPVTLPEDLMQSHSASVLQTVVGGLELSVAFAHRTDRDRVMDAARVLGWNVEDEPQEDSAEDSDEWQRKENLVTMTVSIPRVWLPVHCMLFAGQKHVKKSTFCYLRYKVYNNEPVCSPLARPKVSEDGKQVTALFEQTKSVELTKDQPLLWYLREERLEIQVWRAYGKDPKAERPQDTDRLVGCAYVDLSSLGERSLRKLTVSGVYPLFKRNASDLSGAGVRVHIALASAYHPSVPIRRNSYTEDAGDSEAGQTDDGEPHASDKQNYQKPSSSSEAAPGFQSSEEACEVDMENTFAVNITVERAMHLSLKGSPLTQRSVSTPSCCVSFAVANNDVPISTPVIENTDSPVWNFQQQTRLPKALLLDSQQTLVFKVWHKTDVERVIGFASVDLSPLLSGFQSVCGWYNIGDFSGQCQGQIKVAVTPLESILHLKEEKRKRNESKALDAQAPLQSSAIYQAGRVLSSYLSYTAAHEHPVINPTTQDTSYSAYDRKNLAELDDIQRYFNQKMTVPFPSVTPSSPPKSNLAAVSERVAPAANFEDTDAQQLLHKSQMLVSQVNNMITDLQVKPKDNTPSYMVQDSNNSNSILRPPINGQRMLSRDEDPTVDHDRPVAEMKNTSTDNLCFSSFESLDHRRGMLNEFLDQADFENEDQFPEIQIHRKDAAETVESCSEEDYDEDVIEPITLNEVTAFTDKTSPWSSMISEAEPEAEALPLGRNAEEHPIAKALSEEERMSNLLGSASQEDLQSPPASSRSNDSPPMIEGNDFGGSGGAFDSGSEHSSLQHHDSDDTLKGAGADYTQHFNSHGVEEPNGKNFELDSLPVECFHESNTRDSDEFHENYMKSLGQSRISDVPPKLGDPESDKEKNYCRLGKSTSSSTVESSSEVDHGHLSEDSDSHTEKSSVALSDPVRVPNFFLPPQHLEASMRMLNVSSTLSSTRKTGNGAQGIPFRRRERHKRDLTSTDMPKKETERIAKIFSACYSKND
ncbi:C2 domain-containing protein 3 isoform X2 [Lissotriton helveticus]